MFGLGTLLILIAVLVGVQSIHILEVSKGIVIFFGITVLADFVLLLLNFKCCSIETKKRKIKTKIELTN